MGVIHKAAEEGDIPRMLIEIRNGVRIDSPDEDGVTALLLACRSGKPDAVAFCLRHAASPTTIDDDGFFPLLVAASRGHTAIVEQLLAAGADLGQNIDGYYPLHAAAAYGRRDVVSVLLAHGAQVDARDEQGYERTPLHWAVQEGHREVVRMLIGAGADVNLVDEGFPALHQAIGEGDVDLVRILLEAGANPNLRCAPDANSISLHLACGRGDVEIVRMLLEHGADADTIDDYGRIPLVSALEHGQKDVARFLENWMKGDGDGTVLQLPGHM